MAVFASENEARYKELHLYLGCRWSSTEKKTPIEPSNGDNRQKATATVAKTNRKTSKKTEHETGKSNEHNIKVLRCASLPCIHDDRCRWLASKCRYSTSKWGAYRLAFAPPVAPHRPTVVRNDIRHSMAHVQSPTTFAQISAIYHDMMVMCASTA